LFAGKDITELKSSDLSKVISYLNEDVSLFSGTVRDNISLYRQYNEEVFQQAISEAQIKLNLEREIGDEGNNISSGEQRRIEIARSLLESAKVLIFDEVVSTLDIESAYEIERMALNFKDQTVIFISHNFSGKLIKEYDEILVMEAGRLLAHGTYEELPSSCEYFKRICEIKFG
jgi:ATP-binding cassette subfamily B protein